MDLTNEGKRHLIQDLPEKPGVYKFFDETKTLIYVGKAKSIKKRVTSYFNKLNNLDNKTKRLVSQIESVEYVIVDTEFDAFLLENNLIKSHQPKYNILLKDDKTYPFIYVSNERFPKVLSTRRLERSLGTFYGPYTSVKAMNTVLELIRKLFTIRTCNYNLAQENIDQAKYKICLEYHIGNCKGPCEGLVNEDEYNKNIFQIHQILKGNSLLVKNYFKEQMHSAASNLEFEKAQIFKQKLDLLDKFHNKSVIVSPNITDIDVFTITSDEKNAVVNYFKVVNGTISQTQTLEVKKKLDESDEDILTLAIINIRDKLSSDSIEIVTNKKLELPIDKLMVVVPERGDKRKLLELSLKNSFHHLQKIRDEKELALEKEKRVIKKLQNDLQLKTLPEHIECFDNSNLQGTNPVAAMVCFKNGKPAKKEYRHYNIKTVEGPNDFESMHEIVTRRYKRLLEESSPLPDLIIIDGGKGQLSSACNALIELGIYGKIPIIGIAKRLEEIYYPGDQEPLHIDKKSESLNLIQYIRNEAHRFAITFHRKKRQSNSLISELSSIKGIGEKTFESLMKKFKTVKNIRDAKVEEIAEVVGKKKAEFIKSKLKP